MFSAFRFIIKMWSLHISILILGFVSSVYTETCPAKEDISPCECKIDYGAVKVTCSGLRFRPNLETLQQALSSLSGKVIYQFNLEEFNISIPSNLFSGIGIKKLELMSCHMDVLTNEHQPGLLGLENYLEELGIFTSITIQAKFYLGHLKKLKKITLSYNDIPELVNDWLSNDISSLEYLNIEGNNILKMGSNVFSQLNNLKELSLKDNRFGPIRRSMFPTTADRLEILDLDNNALTHLPEDIFSKMPAIQYVSFERNGITTLDESTWSPVWQQLKNINLHGNPTVCDDRLDWILKSEERPYIMALCSFPKKFENKNLREFFENRTSETFLKFT